MLSNYFSLKNFIPKIKMLPAKAGINKLMNQIPNVVPNMPRVLRLNILNNSVLNFPRIPKSAIANEGTIAKTKNKTLRIQKESIQKISTCSTCSSNIYCRTKTRQRKNDSERSLNNNLAVNSSKTLMYSTNFFDDGIFSINFINHERRKKNNTTSPVNTAEMFMREDQRFITILLLITKQEQRCQPTVFLKSLHVFRM